MKYALPLRNVVVFLVLVVFASTASAQTSKPSDELHVLFIGNSFTQYHDMPKMTAALAEAGKQRTLRQEQITPGGCTLEKHWNAIGSMA